MIYTWKIWKQWHSFVWMPFLFFHCTHVPMQKTLTQKERAFKLLDIARGALLEGDATAALNHLAEAEREDSNLAQIYHLKALGFFYKKDLTLAILNAEKAVKMDPKDSDIQNTLGKLYLEAKRDDLAMEWLLKAAKDHYYRDSYKAWTNLGILKYQQGEYEKAKEFLNQAILADSFRACIAYYYQGQVALRQSQLNTAIDYFSRATKRFCASYGDAYLALGLAYQQNQQYHEARKTFLEVQTLYPHTALSEKAIEFLKNIP